MYTTNDILAGKVPGKPKINRLIKAEAFEVLSISLLAGELFPEHISKKDAHLLVIKGRIQLIMEGENHYLVPQDVVEIPKDIKHSVRAVDDSNFLIFR